LNRRIFSQLFPVNKKNERFCKRFSLSLLRNKKGERKMTANRTNKANENESLLTTLMALIYGSILAMITISIWSVYSLTVNSEAISKIINGGYLR